MTKPTPPRPASVRSARQASPGKKPPRRPKKPETGRAREMRAPATPSPEVDRKEILEPVEEQAGTFENRLHASTRFLRPSFYGKMLGEAGMRIRSAEVDPFGFDPVYWGKVQPFFRFLFDSYWRVKLVGLENIPNQGPALLVANHSGALPYDGVMIKVAVEQKHPSGRALRFLVEDSIFHFPFLGAFINRIGGVRACQDNAQRLLADEQLVAVFPEGVKGIGKLFRDRYQLQRFGRGGFIKLALGANSPIIPVAVVGAEEIHPMLTRLSWLARPLGLPYIPVTPTFPWLGPLGAAPLPSKWTIQFGRPIEFPRHSPEDAEDLSLVMQLAEEVRSTIQKLIDQLIERRESAFF